MSETEQQFQTDYDWKPSPDNADRHELGDKKVSRTWKTEPPMTIAGGFVGVSEELDRRSRDWSLMVRLLSQQRLQLETAENERDRLFLDLEEVLPVVRSTANRVADRLSTTKGGDISGDLSALFIDNLRELDKLENIARGLTANLLWVRASWEQYARSTISAESMRLNPAA